MHRRAVEQAADRLEKAKQSFEQLCSSDSYEQFASGWTDFLAAANTIYTKLEQGAKASNESAGWYGRKKGERRRDELLTYLHQARNADEHGIEPVTHHEPGSVQIKPGPSGGMHLRNLRIVGDQIFLDASTFEGEPPVIEVRPGTAVLVTVRDGRFGNVYEPPKVHLGKPIEDPSPLNVAELGLVYLESLVAEAWDLVA